MKFISPSRLQRGATLIEVLVSIVVASIGLLGMAGLMVVSAKINQEAYERTQVEFLARSLIDSMHVNPSGVAERRYDGKYLGNSKPRADCRRHGCSPPERADYDRAQFDHALAAVLPDARGELRCDGSNAQSPPPAGSYDGVCRLEVDWPERSRNHAGAAQALVWVFQP